MRDEEKQDLSFLDIGYVDDPTFDPERNRRIMREVAENNWKNRLRLKRKHKDEIEERADAVAQFATSDVFRSNRATDQVIKRYFGKKNLKHLRGEKVKSTDYDSLFKPELSVSIKADGPKKNKSKKKSVQTTDI